MLFFFEFRSFFYFWLFKITFMKITTTYMVVFKNPGADKLSVLC
jgi:hypothetical protein